MEESFIEIVEINIKEYGLKVQGTIILEMCMDMIIILRVSENF